MSDESPGDAIGPEARLLGQSDVGRLGEALFSSLRGAVTNPLGSMMAVGRYARSMVDSGLNVALDYVGRPREDPNPVDPEDRRFSDLAWSENPWYRWQLQRWAAFRRLLEDFVDLSGLDGNERRRAEMATELLVDSLAPTNFIWGNPAALKRAFETGGKSVVRGVRNLLHDIAHNGGRPTQVDTSPFQVGGNLACTPGEVVFRSELMELIQYRPMTEQVRSVPLLFSPPWINKYYVLDLAPGRSLIEWAVSHGFTVFAISYRNPDATMRDVSMEDYLIGGPETALDVIEDITGSDRTHLVSLCLGGTLSAMLLGYHASIGVRRVDSFTMINAMVDFSDPGPVSVFTDAEGIRRLQENLKKKGVLSEKEMHGTFDLLRARDLIFSYVVSNWLMGESPPAFDLLAWNEDGTNLPANMHSFYLETCYRDNLLAAGAMELAGHTLDLSRVEADGFVVASEKDHIAPWRTVYETTQVLSSARTRFVMSSGGHIAGIVAPPRKKSWYRTAETNPPNADVWLDGSQQVAESSWWEPWIDWLEERTGGLVPPPGMGSAAYPPLEPAPGTYVLE